MHTPKAICSCHFEDHGSIEYDTPSFILCRLHAAAPQLLEALKACQQLALDRIQNADAAVKTDIYAADALMGIAKITRAAIEAAEVNNG